MPKMVRTGQPPLRPRPDALAASDIASQLFSDSSSIHSSYLPCSGDSKD